MEADRFLNDFVDYYQEQEKWIQSQKTYFQLKENEQTIYNMKYQIFYYYHCMDYESLIHQMFEAQNIIDGQVRYKDINMK